VKHLPSIKTVVLAVALIIFIGVGVSTIVKHNNKLKFKTIELQDTSAKLKLLQQQYDVQLKSKSVDEKKLKELEEQKKELEKQLSAKQEAKRLADAEALKAQQAAQTIANTVTQTRTAYAAPAGVTGNCGDNMYKQYIYQHESGCDTGRYNSIGCFGIGQSCPASKIAHCGTDFACQDAWFSNYAQQRYGGWAAAYQFWLQNRWW
jgi:hypothetical protein